MINETLGAFYHPCESVRHFMSRGFSVDLATLCHIRRRPERQLRARVDHTSHFIIATRAP